MMDMEKLRAITPWDLATLGLERVAYVKPVTTDDGVTVYTIHAADGSEMGVIDDFDTAFAAVRQHDMEPARVH